MKILATALILTLAFTSLAIAGDNLAVTQGFTPRATGQLTLNYEIFGQGQPVELNAKPMQVAGPDYQKAAAILNCEYVGGIDLSNTLLIAPNDFVGNIFAAPAVPNPFHIREVTFGLVDFGQVYPATLAIDFYEDDGVSFQYATTAFVTIPVSPGSGALYTVDVSALNIVMSNDVLTLYGDTLPTEAGGYMIPTADDTPRCFNGSNVCSVHVPALNPQLFIYGFGDPTCPPQNILLADLTHELLVDEIPVSTFESTFGKVKSGFEE